MRLIERLLVECEAADEMMAVMIVRPRFSSKPPASTKLRGVVRGPYCENSRTLPAEFLLHERTDGTLTASIVDPCYSTAELKMEYEFVVQQYEGDDLTGDHASRLELQAKQSHAEP